MNSVKTGLKYNKKVYIIPHDKLGDVMSKHTQANTGQEEQQQQQHEKQQQDEQMTATTLPDNASLANDLQTKLSTHNFNNAMAISYMLGFDPKANATHRDILLYTQLPDYPPPENIVDLYHTLDSKRVPLHLLSNPTVQARLRSMVCLIDDGDEDDYDDSDGDTDEASLRRAWDYYVKERGKRRQQMQKKKKHNKQISQSAISGGSEQSLHTAPSSPQATPPAAAGNGIKLDSWIHLF